MKLVRWMLCAAILAFCVSAGAKAKQAPQAVQQSAVQMQSIADSSVTPPMSLPADPARSATPQGGTCPGGGVCLGPNLCCECRVGFTCVRPGHGCPAC